MSIRFSAVLFLALLLLPSSVPVSAQQAANSSLKLAGIFASDMVLQQQSKAAIWGVAKPGELVTIAPSWSKDVTKVTSDADGKWKTTIQTPAASGPYNIDIKTKADSKRLENVLIGEVWICSGQSNMQWKLRGFGLEHFKEDVDKADHPKLRFCQVPQTIALQSQDDVKTQWSVCTPKSALQFSAVAYFFGDKLRQELDVPIGLISTNWGGSSCEAWVNEQELTGEMPEFAETIDGYAQLIQQHGTVPAKGKKMPKGLNQRSPSVLYNSMIHPLIPFSFRGVIWYQGESNVQRPLLYRKLFPKLIESWRSEWGQGDFPFYYVQIAPFHYRNEEQPVALLREAQLRTLKVPNTGMVVTMDIGNAENIHPKKKKPVGERLALLALAKDYGQSNLVFSGPEYLAHEIESNQIRLKFKHANEGLVSRDGKALSHFSVAGEDRVFHPAQANIDGESILVTSQQVAQPVAVRFGWGNSDAPNLANKQGLPSSSFRTDDWTVPPSKPTKKNSRPARQPIKKKEASPRTTDENQKDRPAELVPQ